MAGTNSNSAVMVALARISPALKPTCSLPLISAAAESIAFIAITRGIGTGGWIVSPVAFPCAATKPRAAP